MTGSTTRVRRIDNGEPLLLFGPPDDDGAEAFSVGTMVCNNPRCGCTQMRLAIRRVKRTGGGKLRTYGAPLLAEVSADGHDLQLDNATGAVTDSARQWIAKHLGDVRHRGWLRERWRRVRGQAGDPAYPSGVLPEQLDELVYFNEVFPYDFDLTVVDDRRLHLADDRYCLKPRCTCDEVAVQFLDLSSDLSGQARSLGLVRAHIRRLSIPRIVGASELRRLWNALLEQCGPARLRERFDRMRKLADARTVVASRSGSSKVGRNAPCPCGSGKKYKRCCGR